jgi:hypothetical protein
MSYALAKLCHPDAATYGALAAALEGRLAELDPGGLASLAWANATAGGASASLFSSLGEEAARRLEAFAPHDLSLLAWAFAVADADASLLFDDPKGRFVARCAQLHDEAAFGYLALSQLHQWHLWRTERGRRGLPPDLRQDCLGEFSRRESGTTVSNAEGSVLDALESLGLRPRRTVVTTEGYEVDLMVALPADAGTGAVATEVATEVAIEVDGPGHFLADGVTPSGRTRLKRRQLRHFGTAALVSVSTAELEGLRPRERAAHLQQLLREATADRRRRR